MAFCYRSPSWLNTRWILLVLAREKGSNLILMYKGLKHTKITCYKHLALSFTTINLGNFFGPQLFYLWKGNKNSFSWKKYFPSNRYPACKWSWHRVVDLDWPPSREPPTQSKVRLSLKELVKWIPTIFLMWKTCLSPGGPSVPQELE